MIVSSQLFGLATGLAIPVAVQAHMLLAEPTPYGKSTLDNGPLLADGSNYPCKLRPSAFAAEGTTNIMPLGSTQRLSFTGSAVHGGGSCQVSLTYDKNPTKDSVFKVIHSITGGCPAKNASGISPTPGNALGAGAGAAGPSTYTFTLPADLPTGEATLAWTWFNKVGNREMYMNCAPVTITNDAALAEGSQNTSSSSKGPRAAAAAAFEAWPDMFRANIGNGCTTVDSEDVDFPVAGDSVDRFGSKPPVPPKGSCRTAAPKGSPVAASGSPSTLSAPPSVSHYLPLPFPVSQTSTGATEGEVTPQSAAVDIPPSTTFITVTTTRSLTIASPQASSTSGRKSSVGIKSQVSGPSRHSRFRSRSVTGWKAAVGGRRGKSQPSRLNALGGDDSDSWAEAETFLPPPPGDLAPTTPETEQLSGWCAPDGAVVCFPGGKSYQKCAGGWWPIALPMPDGTVCSIAV